MDIFIKGGPVMYFILICSVTMAAVFIVKFIHLHKAQINTREFLSGLRNELIASRITEAVGICEETPGPVAGILKAGITHYDEGKTGIESAMEKASTHEISRIEQGISILATIAVISPLFGFLGTVFGLITTFQKMTVQGGLMVPSELAVGMWQALLTTAFGLSVAIPSNMAYNYLTGRVQRLVRNMEESSAELVAILCTER